MAGKTEVEKYFEEFDKWIKEVRKSYEERTGKSSSTLNPSDPAIDWYGYFNQYTKPNEMVEILIEEK